MCLAEVVIDRAGSFETLCKNATLIEIDGDNVHVTDLLGRHTSARGTIRTVDFAASKVVVVSSAADDANVSQ